MSVDCIALILGRKGSKGLPGKNTMQILGRPISHYPIMAALNAKYIADVFVSTDDKKIKSEAKKFNLQVIDRPKELCSDAALFEDALIHGYHEIIKRRNRKPDMVVILMCNVVTVDNILIDNAVEALINDPEADSAVTVSKLNMYSPLRARKLSQDGYLKPFVSFESFGDPSSLSCDRDSQGDVFFADMSHSVSRSRALDDIDNGLLPQRWMGQKIVPVYNTYGCDIDLPWQVNASLWWLAERGFSDRVTPYEKHKNHNQT
jgi:CMP-N-acetylneuraminic acid synthetase